MSLWCKRPALFAALAAVLVLGGCGDPPRPFQPTAGKTDNELLVLSEPAGIVVDEVGDLPQAGQKRFVAALVDELHKAEVPATTGAGNPQSFRLKGQVLEFPSATGTDLQISWLLVDAQGQPQGNHAVRRSVDTEAWQAGDPKLLAQLARESSVGIVKLLPDNRPALAARIAPPPKPGVIANNIVPPLGTGLGQTPRQAASKPVPRPQAAQAASAPAAIPAVALRAVEGAPGDGAQALNAAMRHFLARASIPVVEESQNPAAIIVCKVGLSDVGVQQQEVRVDWAVLAPDGKRLGTISQANRISAGRLNGAWGGIAIAVAENAVQGLGELFDHLVPSGASPAKAPSQAQAPQPK